jgi:hypothetical protein
MIEGRLSAAQEGHKASTYRNEVGQKIMRDNTLPRLHCFLSSHIEAFFCPPAIFVRLEFVKKPCCGTAGRGLEFAQ